MIRIDKVPIIVGAYDYLSKEIYNAPSIKIEEKYTKHLVLLNGFASDLKIEGVLFNPKSYDDEVKIENCIVSGNSISRGAKNKRLIDISKGDLSLNSDVLVLNFTQSPLTVVNSIGLVKTYIPIVNEKLKYYEGKIIFIEVHNFNNPNMIKAITNINNYLDPLCNKLGSSVGFKQAAKVFPALEYATKYMDTKLATGGDINTNSIKVVTMYFLEGSDIASLNEGEELFSEYYGALLTRKDVLECPINPAITSSGFSVADFKNINEAYTYKILINDPDSFIGDRYINIAGSIEKIQKTQNRNAPEGLLIVIRDSKGEISKEFFPLNELDDNHLVFKSKEEALLGADKFALFKSENDIMTEQIRREKIKYEIYVTELKKELKEKEDLINNSRDNLRLEMEQANHKRSEELLDKQNNREEETYKTELLLKDLKKDMEQDKYKHEKLILQMKETSDHQKSESEKVLMSIKYLGAGIAFGAAILAAWKTLR